MSVDMIGTGGAGGLQGGSNGNNILPNLNSLGLAPLGFYGGPTQTIALLPGSAAIKKGSRVSGVTTDQRGEPVDSPPDIGAFQVQFGLVVNTTSDGMVLSAGDLSVRQAVTLANVMDVAATITFDPTEFASAQTIVLGGSPLELNDTGGTEAIMGPAAGVTISAGGLSRVFQIDGDVTASLSGVTITDGSTTGNGGGLYNSGTTTLDDVTISGNTANSGGGRQQSLRWHDHRDGSGAVDHCGHSGYGRHGRLHGDLQHEKRGHGADVDAERHGGRRQRRRQLHVHVRAGVDGRDHARSLTVRASDVSSV